MYYVGEKRILKKGDTIPTTCMMADFGQFETKADAQQKIEELSRHPQHQGRSCEVIELPDYDARPES